MSLVPWNPFRDIDNIGREINSFFDYPAKLFAGHSPRVDVYQTEDEVVVKAEIPGVSREDLSLYVDDRSVRISGETRREEKYSENDTYRSERYYGSFSRTVPLPAEVKPDEARAEYKDGILTVTVPEAEQSKGRKIDIQ